MAVKKKYDRSVLGRGLDSIGSGRGLGLDALINTNDIRTKGTANLLMLPIDKIEPNPDQPRHEFDESALKELAVSIREIGVIVPITVRQMEGENYQIIAGERRWRASSMAGLKELPAYMNPDYFKIRSSMPVHSNGKRDVGALRDDRQNLIKA